MANLAFHNAPDTQVTRSKAVCSAIPPHKHLGGGYMRWLTLKALAGFALKPGLFRTEYHTAKKLRPLPPMNISTGETGATLCLTGELTNTMDIYIVIIEGRNVDVTAYPFTSKEKAVSEARRIAKELCNFPKHYQEYDSVMGSEWHFSIEYSSEGDCVSVRLAVLDKEIE
jgi:hypothetical protein